MTFRKLLEEDINKRTIINDYHYVRLMNKGGVMTWVLFCNYYGKVTRMAEIKFDVKESKEKIIKALSDEWDKNRNRL